MHISEGVLSGQTLLAGGVLTVAGTAIGLKTLDYDRITHVGILSASFFVASLIHVPVGPSSVHLIMNGIVGLILGWAVFPAILVALLLQGVFFQYGGITTLGVNTVIMAAPAVVCHYVFGPFVMRNKIVGSACAFGCSFFSVFFGAILVALFLIATQEGFFEVATLVVLANIPVMIIEGIVTVFAVAFLKKVYPDLLPRPKHRKGG